METPIELLAKAFANHPELQQILSALLEKYSGLGQFPEFLSALKDANAWPEGVTDLAQPAPREFQLIAKCLMGETAGGIQKLHPKSPSKPSLEEPFEEGPCYQVFFSWPEKFGDALYAVTPGSVFFSFALWCFRTLTRPKYQTTAHQAIAEKVLREEQGKEPEALEVEELASALRQGLRKAEKAIGLESATKEQILEPPEEQGMLLWDLRFANFLATLGEAGRKKAEEVREASRKRWLDYQHPTPTALPEPLPSGLWRLWVDPALELPTTLRAAYVLAKILWRDVVKPRLEKERRANVRAPTDIAKALTRARGGRVTTLFSESSILVTPHGCDHQLSLPLGTLAKIDGKEVEIRRALSGGALKTYFAAWALWCDEGAHPRGVFQWNEQRVHEYFGTKKDKRGQASGTPRKLLKENFESLLRISVTGVKVPNAGTIGMSTPEALIQHYFLREFGDQGPNAFRHSPLLVDIMGRHFVQIPRAVLRLDARGVPHAVGLAVLLRRKVHEILSGPGHYRSTFRELLEEIGEDYAEGAQRYGRKYWSETAQKLLDVAKEGELGEIHLQGEGPEAIATVTLSARLGEAYATILDRARMHAKEDTKARQTAKVLEAKRLRAKKSAPNPTK